MSKLLLDLNDIEGSLPSMLGTLVEHTTSKIFESINEKRSECRQIESQVENADYYEIHDLFLPLNRK